jgi:hypothetical protein
MNIPSMIYIIYILFFLAISPAKGAVNCDTSSPECCWVIRSWELMGQKTSVSSTNPSDCCQMDGVTCAGSNIIGIRWDGRGLTNQIPSDIRNLQSLKRL